MTKRQNISNRMNIEIEYVSVYKKKMSDSVNLEEIKNYIEGPSHEHPCTISVPKYVSITIEVFLNEILQRIQKEPSQITPQDIVELIKNSNKNSAYVQSSINDNLRMRNINDPFELKIYPNINFFYQL